MVVDLGLRHRFQLQVKSSKTHPHILNNFTLKVNNLFGFVTSVSGKVRNKTLILRPLQKAY